MENNYVPNINGQQSVITLTSGEIINCIYYGCCEDGTVIVDQYRNGITVLRELNELDIVKCSINEL